MMHHQKVPRHPVEFFHGYVKLPYCLRGFLGHFRRFAQIANRGLKLDPSTEALPEKDVFVDYSTTPKTLGILVKPRAKTSFALTYHNAGTVTRERTRDMVGGTSTILAALGPAGETINTLPSSDDLPQGITASSYERITPRLSLLSSVGWLDWSGGRKDEVTPTSVTIPPSGLNNQEDRWHLGLGAQYRLLPPLLLTAGVGFDAAHGAEGAGADDITSGEQLRYAAAVRYKPTSTFSIGSGYLFIDQNQPDVAFEESSLTLWGADNDIHFMGIDLSIRF